MQNTDNQPLVNRVAQSGIITLNLEDYFPRDPIAVFDLKDYLFRGLILREKDFRQAVDTHDWAQYQDKNVCIVCTADAIIPMWAYQLVSVSLAPFARLVVCGDEKTLIHTHYMLQLAQLDLAEFQDKRIVVKGCGDKPVPAAAYAEIARRLQPVARSIMYGEPCSTVPLFKRKA